MLLTPECTLFLVSPSHVRKVSLIRTERVAEAGDIMEIMKDADAVLVAGGDGTIMEAVTGSKRIESVLTARTETITKFKFAGLMRRPDASKLGTTLPIGVLPVGKSNHLAHNLFPSISSSGKIESEVEMMAGAAMSCVKSIYRPVDVMQVGRHQFRLLNGTPVFASGSSCKMYM